MDHVKLSPSLAAAYETFRARGRPALGALARDLGVVSGAPTPRPPRVVVFVHARDGASLDHLGELGVEVNPGQGVRTAIAPLDALDALSEDPAVARVVASERLELAMDVASAKVGVPALRRSSGLSGRGVVVGIVDTGIDVAHPSFAGRVRQIWDQTLPGQGVAEGAYGVELTGPMMRTSRDVVGHGTHVAGIAAGADATFGGVAPEADLVIVKTDLLTAHLADAIRYVFRVAADLGRPAVVNLSLGGHGDAHDGTDSLSVVLDAESGPGRIVCCAAGNEGDDDIHARVALGQGRYRSIAVQLPVVAPGATPEPALFNGWYEGDDVVEVAVVAPGGARTPYQAVITSGSPVRVHELPEGVVTIVTPGPDPANGDHNFLVLLRPDAVDAGAPPPGPGAWRIRLRGVRIASGRVDVWSVNKRSAQFSGWATDDAVKVGAPAAAGRAVSVASYTTRVDWEDMFGTPRHAGLDLDDISDFSSEGPRRDGAEKPDVAAPGAMIVSAVSAHAPGRPENMVDAHHVVNAGTSMAAPFVTGLVALLLERDPLLDPEALKALLRAHSTVPDQPPGTFDPKWGYGLVDARGLAEGDGESASGPGGGSEDGAPGDPGADPGGGPEAGEP